MSEKPENNEREETTLVNGGSGEEARAESRVTEHGRDRSKDVIVLGGGSGQSRLIREAARKLVEEAGFEPLVIEDRPVCGNSIVHMMDEIGELAKPEKPVEPWRVKKGRRQRGGFPRYQ